MGSGANKLQKTKFVTFELFVEATMFEKKFDAVREAVINYFIALLRFCSRTYNYFDPQGPVMKVSCIS